MVDLVKCKFQKLLQTKFSMGELSRENWCCRLACYCACSQLEMFSYCTGTELCCMFIFMQHTKL